MQAKTCITSPWQQGYKYSGNSTISFFAVFSPYVIRLQMKWMPCIWPFTQHSNALIQSTSRNRASENPNLKVYNRKKIQYAKTANIKPVRNGCVSGEDRLQQSNVVIHNYQVGGGYTKRLLSSTLHLGPRLRRKRRITSRCFRLHSENKICSSPSLGRSRNWITLQLFKWKYRFPFSYARKVSIIVTMNQIRAQIKQLAYSTNIRTRKPY